MKKIMIILCLTAITSTAYGAPQIDIIIPQKNTAKSFFIEVRTDPSMPVKYVRATITDAGRNIDFRYDLLRKQEHVWTSSQEAVLEEGAYTLKLVMKKERWTLGVRERLDFYVTAKDAEASIGAVMLSLNELTKEVAALRQTDGTLLRTVKSNRAFLIVLLAVGILTVAGLLFLAVLRAGTFKLLDGNTGSSRDFRKHLNKLSGDLNGLEETTDAFLAGMREKENKNDDLIEGLIRLYDDLDARNGDPASTAAYKSEIEEILHDIGIERWAPQKGEVACVDCEKDIAEDNGGYIGENRVVEIIRFGWKMRDGDRKLIIRNPRVSVTKGVGYESRNRFRNV